VKAWTPIETEEPWAIPLESDEPVREIQYQAAAVPDKEPRERPSWAVPAGIAAAVLLLGGAAFAVSHSNRNATPLMQTIASQPSTTQRPVATAPVIRTDSAAGTIASTASTAASDSAFAAIRDSITAADEARQARREKAAAEAAAAEAEKAQRPRTVTDSTGTVWMLDKPAGFGTKQVVPADSIKPKPDTSHLVAPPPVLPKPDTAVKPRSDTTVKPKPDTLLKPKPDTAKCCRN
jgi:hypothetical protein